MGLSAITTNAYNDWFTRNIIGVHTPGLAGEPGYETFTSNAPTVTWPTIAEATDFLGGSVSNTTALGLALDAAISRIAERTLQNVQPVDPVTGEVDPGGTPVAISPEVKFAVLLQTHRWYARKDSPQGVIGVAEFTGVVRTSSFDPDVEALLGNTPIAWGLA